MTNSVEMKASSQSLGWKFFNAFFGVVVIGIGTVNIFWGNDPGFGIFLIVLSSAYFPPIQALLKEKTGRTIPGLVKFLLGVFILWAALGVGELFDKVDMMIHGL
ncbi:hypothetical protein [Dawidia soli]|uniref:Uncharacterized protein n=1 Tax=Dawidia soli TaxID=2782352 RepID=A0AAP2DJ99_9BACT|nr:hypothetical protein [Dawidia soli]MBT1690477.1 hypothetical protein [Dawidia soli]